MTRPGLPLAPGEPAINPAPRAMIREQLNDVAEANGAPPPDVTVTIAIPGGERLAEKTMNRRLGIVGGLSVLGTTGIVVPYSCASWIHAIHRGIDVARAAGLRHIAAATGTTSEKAVQRRYGLPEHALIDMGDFVGGTLKYLRSHPVPRLTLAGGFAKLAKLAAGHLDLHSSRSRVDPAMLAALLADAGGAPETVAAATHRDSAAEILDLAGPLGPALAESVARRAREVALATLSGGVAVEVAIVDRAGVFLAHVGAPDSRRDRRMTAPRPLLHRLLILGGTGEAAALARAALARFGDAISVTTALAGRTRNPGPIPGNVRIGGFGGPAGLGAYLVEHRIDRLIDATHPFAAEISRSARLAAERAGVKRLLLLRPRWKRHPLDRWIEVDSIEAAASLVGRIGRCALLTVGAGTAAAFARAEGVRFIVRLDRSAARGTAVAAIPDRLRARAVQPAVRAAAAAAIRDRCARLQGERRRGHRGETDRGARGRNSGHHGAAPAAANRGKRSTSIEAALDWLADLDQRQEEGRMP